MANRRPASRGYHNIDSDRAPVDYDGRHLGDGREYRWSNRRPAAAASTAVVAVPPAIAPVADPEDEQHDER